MEKISIFKIIVNSFIIPWNNLSFYSQVLAIPVLVLVAIWSVWVIILPTGQASGSFFIFIYFIAFTYLAITCHKLILTESKSLKEIVAINIQQMFLFFMFAFIVYIMSFLIKFIIITICLNVFLDPLSNGMGLETAEYIAYLPSMYIVGRLCIIFPAIALGYNPGLRWAWKTSRNNHLHILFIVAIFPWVLQFFISVIYRLNATLIEQVIIALLSYLSAIIGVFAISLIYKELYTIEQQNDSRH